MGAGNQTRVLFKSSVLLTTEASPPAPQKYYSVRPNLGPTAFAPASLAKVILTAQPWLLQRSTICQNGVSVEAQAQLVHLQCRLCILPYPFAIRLTPSTKSQDRHRGCQDNHYCVGTPGHSPAQISAQISAPSLAVHLSQFEILQWFH